MDKKPTKSSNFYDMPIHTLLNRGKEPEPGTTDVSDIAKCLEIIQRAEDKLFDFLWYPRTNYQKGSIQSFENRDQEMIETMFSELEHSFKQFPENPLYKILKKKEALFRAYEKA